MENNETQLPAAKHLDFSLFYFGNADIFDDANEKYKLLIEGAKYGDRNGFTAVWTPERHFNEFAGLYPSPAVMAGNIAAHTKNIGIRAGSVVIPLHNPIRVAEDWCVADNLSGGRVGIACASGWQANDFVLASNSYKNRHEVMYKNIDSIQRLWRGESISMEDGHGHLKDTKIYPRPLQKSLPMWITTNGNPDTFRSAGRLGFGILTNFWGSSLDELGPKIEIYREAYKEGGHPKGKGKIVLMLHTFIAGTREEAYEKARTPLINYLRSSFGLLQNNAVSGNAAEVQNLSKEEIDNILDYSFRRYVSGSSLVGAAEDVIKVLHKVSSLGVDEIACLLDFGIDYTSVVKNLDNLTAVKDAWHNKVKAAAGAAAHT
ncbi:MupA/Atu3671 family FMN-dependent luciferase-like monooxygenase [Chitinophaga solisilvae]|uniref:LLM class flavin-dependent oxidoreductase n=1 Tax=Chitinophaga solisilvae TaxID=1233460 RepID=A0A433WFJ2_9BACT|nr:MupA/Atu3671 family FMN-dependent luciferase-like monooxygenase [Chitinophaga solisilvae]NSL86239.1 LLM class flavin-dependent oxidoreductase [Chitinophaga solisilvae]